MKLLILGLSIFGFVSSALANEATVMLGNQAHLVFSKQSPKESTWSVAIRPISGKKGLVIKLKGLEISSDVDALQFAQILYANQNLLKDPKALYSKLVSAIEVTRELHSINNSVRLKNYLATKNIYVIKNFFVGRWFVGHRDKDGLREYFWRSSWVKREFVNLYNTVQEIKGSSLYLEDQGSNVYSNLIDSLLPVHGFCEASLLMK